MPHIILCDGYPRPCCAERAVVALWTARGESARLCATCAGNYRKEHIVTHERPIRSEPTYKPPRWFWQR